MSHTRGEKVPLLANDFTVLYESPDPSSIFCYSPGLVRLPNGRLVATLDLGGPGVRDFPATARWAHGENGNDWVGKVFTSDDDGHTWTHRTDFPFLHARPLIAGNRLYVLGRAADLMIIASDDGGTTWSAAMALTEGQYWHQSACNVHYANGNVYLVMERRVSFDLPRWYVNELAPVLMRAPVGADLTRRENWTFASEVVFRDLVSHDDLFGIPFWGIGNTDPTGNSIRRMEPMGWLETNVVQFLDPDHLWCDPTGHTFHLWMRAHTGGTGYACVLKVVEQPDGSMQTETERTPSGRQIVYLPCPGGQMRFHVLYDAQTARYWLLSTLAEDSMTRPERLSPLRHGLTNNERQVLALHFSRNMVDWRLAGIVAHGDSPREARHYASMIISGDDLLVLSRSGDHRARNAHDGNLITLHRVRAFRDLVY